MSGRVGEGVCGWKSGHNSNSLVLKTCSGLFLGNGWFGRENSLSSAANSVCSARRLRVSHKTALREDFGVGGDDPEHLLKNAAHLLCMGAALPMRRGMAHIRGLRQRWRKVD